MSLIHLFTIYIVLLERGYYNGSFQAFFYDFEPLHFTLEFQIISIISYSILSLFL